MNRMSRGEAPGPAWAGLQGSKLMGWRFHDVAEKKQERSFPVSRIEQGLQVCVELRRPAAAGKRNGGLVEDKRADIRGQKCGFQGTKPPERMPEEDAPGGRWRR